MKRFIQIIAMAAVLLTAASTAFAQNGPRGQLYAGAAKVDITPDVKDLPATSQGILDHCYVRVIVFGNGATKAALISFDAASAKKHCRRNVLPQQQ